MGTVCVQKCIVGVKIPFTELKVVIEEKKTEIQNEYDRSTGKVIRTKEVVVKDEVLEYRWSGNSYKTIEELQCNINRGGQVGCWSNYHERKDEDACGDVFIGLEVIENESSWTDYKFVPIRKQEAPIPIDKVHKLFTGAESYLAGCGIHKDKIGIIFFIKYE
jgi:hypothetical protein